ncbi:MAG: alpha/beta fold hydrolase [Dehalococcoidia bacterium]
MPKAPVNGIDLWYELSEPPGGGDAPLLVLTHGFAGPRWPPIIDEFRARFRLLWYHVRGHGRSSVPGEPTAYSLPQFAADLAALLDTLGIQRAHIGGVSMGGMVSAQFACDYPERLRSLLLCDTTCGNGAGDDAARAAETGLRDAFDRMALVAEKYGLAELVERENRYRREQDLYARTRRASMEEQDAENARKIADMTAAGYARVARALIARPDLVPRLPSITAPALVSCGEWDLFYPCAVRDAALITHARMATVRGAAHATPDYQPQLWKRAVCDFIDDVEAGRDVRGAVEYRGSS